MASQQPESSKAKVRSQVPLPPNISLQPIDKAILPFFRRLISLLLPIRYPDKFFAESIANTTETSLARVALWHEVPPSTKISNEDVPNPEAASRFSSAAAAISASDLDRGKVVAGIQCKIEPPTASPNQDLYIQTLAVLAPYRQLGLATHLLDTVVDAALSHHQHVSSVYAHVWEKNEDALEWYERRGFVVEEGVVQHYYRKLRPAGARIVRKRIGIEDHLRLTRENMADETPSGVAASHR